LAAQVKSGHKAVKKRLYFTVFRHLIAHGLNITPPDGFGKPCKRPETPGTALLRHYLYRFYPSFFLGRPRLASRIFSRVSGG
jgi:hypothetical protein